MSSRMVVLCVESKRETCTATFVWVKYIAGTEEQRRECPHEGYLDQKKCEKGAYALPATDFMGESTPKSSLLLVLQHSAPSSIVLVYSPLRSHLAFGLSFLD
jgi:hypothetical protein